MTAVWSHKIMAKFEGSKMASLPDNRLVAQDHGKSLLAQFSVFRARYRNCILVLLLGGNRHCEALLLCLVAGLVEGFVFQVLPAHFFDELFAILRLGWFCLSLFKSLICYDIIFLPGTQTLQVAQPLYDLLIVFLQSLKHLAMGRRATGASVRQMALLNQLDIDVAVACVGTLGHAQTTVSASEGLEFLFGRCLLYCRVLDGSL